MTGRSLHDLFDDAVRDQPDGPPLESVVDADIARGHRRRRRRYATGAGVVAALTAAAVALPPLLESEDARREPVPMLATGDPVTQDVWAAVSQSLPEDTSLTSEPTVMTGGPALEFELTRGEDHVYMRVAVQESRPDLPRFNPCASSHEVMEHLYGNMSCTEGKDDEGRWQMLAAMDTPGEHMAIIEAGTASVTTTWSEFPGGSPGGGSGDSRVLTETEVLTVAGAVWDSVSSRPSHELSSGLDMSRMDETDLERVVEETLELDVEEQAPVDVGGDVLRRWRFTADDDVTVTVDVWEKDRLYSPTCSRLFPERCGDLPKRSFSVADPERSTAGTGEAQVMVGVRSGIDILIMGAPVYKNRLVTDLATAIAGQIPLQHGYAVDPEDVEPFYERWS